MVKSTGKPVFVLVHGAWHRPAHMSRVRKLLEDAGYEVISPALPSIRWQPADTGNALHDDADLVADVLRKETKASKNVILMMHSYAGFPCSDAVAMVCEEQNSNPEDIGRGKIIQLIYLAAFAVKKGMDVMTLHKVPADAPLPPLVSDKGLLHPDPADEFYNTTPKEIADEATAILEPIAISAFVNKPRYTGWRDYGIPVKYIGCKQDKKLMPWMQQGFIDDITAAGLKDFQSEWWDCDHSPFLGRPQEVAQVLLEVAEKHA